MNLFVDTTNSYIILALFNDRLIAQTIVETNKNQSEIFFNVLDSFLVENNTAINNIENYYFAAGPGSFTGIRVGLSFAKALLCSGKKNVFTISSLDMLFDNYHNSKAIIDARGDKYYLKEINNGVFGPVKLVSCDEINNPDEYCSYANSCAQIPFNVVELVKLKKYSSTIDSIYVKDAF